MADYMYDYGAEEILKGNIDLSSDTIKAVLVDTDDYSADIDNDQNLDDIPAGARVATGTLASKTVTDGVFDAADLTLSSVSGDVSEAIVIYKDSGVESTSTLICYIDAATGLPVTPNGGDIVITWDASGLFRIGVGN